MSKTSAILQKFKELTEDKGFQVDLFAFRKKWNIPKHGLKSSRGEAWHRDLYTQAEKINDYQKNILDLVKKYNISDSLLQTLKSYILYNSLDWSPHIINIVEHINLTDPSRNTLSLTIYPETSLRDVQNIWNLVNIHQSRLRGFKGKGKRIKDKPKVSRDQRIMVLTKNHTDKEIIKMIQKEFGENLSYDYIPKIRDKMKKRRHS